MKDLFEAVLFDEAVRLINVMKKLEPGTDEYNKVLTELQEVVHMERQYKEKSVESKMDKFLNNPALVGLVSTWGATLLVLNYERLEIITSRAFSWIRPK